MGRPGGEGGAPTLAAGAAALPPEGANLALGRPGGEVDDEAIARAADAQGMTVRPLSRYYLGVPEHRGLILGYGYVPTERVPPWAQKLCELVRARLPA